MSEDARRSANAEHVTLRDDDVALLASDVHLGGHDLDTARAFLDALADEARRATHVFLLGDVFDAWVGDDDPDEFSHGVVTLLSALTRNGCRVHVMRGNRDFLLDVGGGACRARFAADSGARMLADPCVIDAFGTPTLLSHGDALCTDDVDYQRFRAMVRSEAWQHQFLARPLEEREGVARDLRARSELSKAEKTAYLMDVNPAAVQAAMRAADCRVLVHGHTHRPGVHRFELGGVPAERWVLPDWDAAAGRGGLLRLTRSGLQFIGRFQPA